MKRIRYGQHNIIRGSELRAIFSHGDVDPDSDRWEVRRSRVD